jgi:hypothetical protein
MGLKELIQRRQKQATKTIELFPSDFADEWEEKPETKITIGLRLVPETEMHKARANASQKAVKSSTDREIQVDIYNDLLMAWAVAEGTCQAADTTQPWMRGAVDVIPRALTSRAIRRVYDELEKLHIESSPLHHEASNDELLKLAARLSLRSPFEHFKPIAEARMRRVCSYLLDEITDRDPDPVEEDE